VFLSSKTADHLGETGPIIKCMVLGCISGPTTASIPATIKMILNTDMENISLLPENIKAIGNLENSTVLAV